MSLDMDADLYPLIRPFQTCQSCALRVSCLKGCAVERGVGAIMFTTYRF